MFNTNKTKQNKTKKPSTKIGLPKTMAIYYRENTCCFGLVEVRTKLLSLLLSLVYLASRFI